MRKIICSIIIFCLPIIAFSQYFSSGQDPAFIRWKIIKTRHVKVIFPENYQEKAMRIANILDTVYSHEAFNFRIKPRIMPVVLHPYSGTSNAFVGWAPKRIEYFTVPPQDMYPQPWFQQLGLHEFRHVVQISQMYQGMTKFISYLSGQQGPVGLLGTYIPFWFLEGDAVFTETYYSKSGRGRVPSFTMPLRTQITNENAGIFSYDKAVFGSYKDFVPDHYVLGYHLVTNAYNQYGQDMWPQVLNHVARNPYMIVPFSEGLRKQTGLNKTKYYRSSLEKLRYLWRDQIQKNSEIIRKKKITSNTDVYTQYRFPKQLRENEIIALKKSINRITRIVSIDEEGNERDLHKPGLISGEMLSANDSYICWVEKSYDPRWSNREYSNIFLYDIENGKTKKLTHKGRYFAAAISPDSKTIAAAEVSVTNSYSLVLLNSTNGKMIKKITTPENYYFQLPSWSDDGNRIVFTLLGNKGKSLATYHLESDRLDYHTGFSKINISQGVFYHDHIIFVGTYDGINNLYAVDLSNENIWQITSSDYGVFDPEISNDGQHILCSEYTANGYSILKIPIDTGSWKMLENEQYEDKNPYTIINDEQRFVLSDKTIPDKNHEVKKYSKLLRLFDFHSWTPIYFDFNNDELDPGIIFLTQNRLSTAFGSVGWKYDLNEETGRYMANFSYRGWYPIIDIGFEYGKRKDIFRDTNDVKYPYSFYQTKIETGVRVPFRFTHHHYFRGFQPYVRLTQNYLTKDKSADLTIKPRDYISAEYGIYLYNQTRKSHRDIIPKWGQSLSLHYANIPFEIDNSSVSAVETLLYFPGLMNNHGFRAYLGYQALNRQNYSFSSEISNPRGYSGLYYDNMFTFKLDYMLPLLYPDFSVSSLLYVKRVRASLFYDYARGETGNILNELSSTGLDLRFDIHILRFISPFDVGLRSIYLPDQNETKFEILFAINVDALY